MKSKSLKELQHIQQKLNVLTLLRKRFNGI